jgi:bla regulator protein blaR1
MRYLILVIALAQSPDRRKEFDVVSVKASAPDDHNGLMMQTLPGGGIRFVGVPLRMIMMSAYDVKAFQISGGPDWIRTERWDVLAKVDGVDGKLPFEQIPPMIQALIADRFGLRVHKETKVLPVYALSVDRKGSKLALDEGGGREVHNGNGTLAAKKIGMDWFSEWLSRKLGRVVIDKTDLKGEYDYKLAWSPDPEEGNPDYTGMPPEAPRAHGETTGPSIFTALQEQLGLRLVSEKGAVEIVVIDSVARPSAN